jgi:hypothetical protein
MIYLRPRYERAWRKLTISQQASVNRCGRPVGSVVWQTTRTFRPWFARVRTIF